MRKWYTLKERYLRGQLPIRLGNLASNLARIKSPSQNAANGELIESLLEESKLFIEGTAQDAEIEIAAELVESQIQLACWQYSWARIWEDVEQRMKVGEQGRIWSGKVLNMSSLLAVNQVGMRSPSVQSAHFEMVEMDKIVSKKRGWVTPASTQPTKKGDRTNGEQQSHLFLLYQADIFTQLGTQTLSNHWKIIDFLNDRTLRSPTLLKLLNYSLCQSLNPNLCNHA